MNKWSLKVLEHNQKQCAAAKCTGTMLVFVTSSFEDKSDTPHFHSIDSALGFILPGEGKGCQREKNPTCPAAKRFVSGPEVQLPVK